MTFNQYWETDEAFAYRHADERTQAEAAWNAALDAAAAKCDDIDKGDQGWGGMAAWCAEKIRELKSPSR